MMFSSCSLAAGAASGMGQAELLFACSLCQTTLCRTAAKLARSRGLCFLALRVSVVKTARPALSARSSGLSKCCFQRGCWQHSHIL